jgi:hypothetical protein
MRDPMTEQAYFALREQVSLLAARLSGENCGRIVHHKLAIAYAARNHQALVENANDHG